MRCDDCTKYAEVCHVCEPVRKLGSIIETNGVKPTLSEVLAKVEKRAFWDYVPGRAIRIEDLEDVLSEYFA